VLKAWANHLAARLHAKPGAATVWWMNAIERVTTMNSGADELNGSLKQLQEVWRVSNQYNAAACCSICSGVVQHEPWCVIVNKDIEYAFLLAVDPVVITEGDKITLHSLGVAWHSAASCE
jgi:hypothetical protein